MSKTGVDNPPEMEKLLAKYRGGNVPPLAVKSGEKHDGLLSEELVEILRKGFSAAYAIPLCVSVISNNHGGVKDRKQESESPNPFIPRISKDLSYQELKALLTSCGYIRSLKRNSDLVKDAKQEMKDDGRLSSGLSLGFQPCEYCSAKHWLPSSRENGKARAYMCYAGMIGIFAPVCVAGETIAVLSTECRKPKPGTIWPSGIVGQDAYSSDAIESTKMTRVDIWQEAWNRIQECGRILGFNSGDFLKKVTESVKMEPRVEVSPEDLESLMIGLENASRHLSDLADKTYRLEKESVIGWLRAEMASALSSADDFWNRIRWCFENLAQLVGVDYIILLSRDKSQSGTLNLQSQYGLSQESIPALQYDWTGSKTLVDDFVSKINALEHIQEIDLKQYRDLPILGMLYDLYGRGVSYPVLIAPTTTMEGRLIFMVLGRKEPQTIVEDRDGLRSTGHSAQEWLQEDDQQYMMIIVRELAIITNVFYSMQRLQETVEAQTNLMESVAHDLRTPIQSIMIAAENLRECRVAPERASHTIAGVVTQLQRLNLLAQKAWMLERIRLDKMIYNDAQTVNPHLIFEECKEILTDMAERSSIDIFIDPDVENWQAINLDAEMFRLMVLNLLHNAIKYSFPNTHIKVGGWQDSGGMGTTMTFENEGIAIHDEEKDRIFERYFRSKDAVQMEPAGSGIGLALVKEFVDHYKGIINVKSTEVGFGKYLNVFSLFLPGR